MLGLRFGKGCALSPPQTIVALSIHVTMLCPLALGKAKYCSLPCPLHKRAMAALVSLSSACQASEGLKRVLRQGHLGQDQLAAWVRLGLKKALRERKGGIALEGRGTKVTNYIPSEANIKNLIRSCATVLLQGHPFVAVPPSSYALFPGQLSFKVPPCSTSSWAFKGYFGGINALDLGSRLLSEPYSGPSVGAPPHMPTIPQTYSRLPRVATSGHHSKAALTLCPKAR